MEAIRFGIITPTFNRSETFLPWCVESVRQLELAAGKLAVDYVHVIVDDGSADGTPDYLEELATQDQRVLPVYNDTNQGPGVALRSGYDCLINRSRRMRACNNIPTADTLPHFIIPLDDDDGLLPDALVTYANHIVRDPAVGLWLGPAAFLDADNRPTDDTHGIDYNDIRYSSDPAEFFKIMLESNQVVCAPAMSTWDLMRTGLWRSEYDCQDWFILLALLREGVKAGLIPEAVGYYRMHGKQASLRHMHDGTWQREGEQLREHFGKQSRRLTKQEFWNCLSRDFSHKTESQDYDGGDPAIKAIDP